MKQREWREREKRGRKRGRQEKGERHRLGLAPCGGGDELFDIQKRGGIRDSGMERLCKVTEDLQRM